MTVRAAWRGGVSFAIEAGSGHKLITDGSPDHGGTNAGFRPMELLLASAAACSAYDVVHILKRGRHEFASVAVDARGERADAVPAVFTSIELAFAVKGASREATERAVRLSVDKYCSALAMLNQTAKVGGSLEHADA